MVGKGGAGGVGPPLNGGGGLVVVVAGAGKEEARGRGAEGKAEGGGKEGAPLSTRA